MVVCSQSVRHGIVNKPSKSNTWSKACTKIRSRSRFSLTASLKVAVFSVIISLVCFNTFCFAYVYLPDTVSYPTTLGGSFVGFQVGVGSTSSSDSIRGIAVDSFGNSFITGSTRGAFARASAGNYDVFVIKVSTSSSVATELWRYQTGTSSSELSYGIAVDSSGNSFITGYTSGALIGSNAGSSDIFVIKLASGGSELWRYQTGTSSSDYSYGIAVDSSGNSFITGYTSGALIGSNAGPSNYYYADIFVIKLDSNGSELWRYQTGTPTQDYSNGIAVDSSGNSLITGYTSGALIGSNAGSSDIFVIKLDSSGSELWRYQTGTPTQDYSHDIAVDSSGNSFITGRTYGNLIGSGARSLDIFVIKLDSSGSELWRYQTGTSSSDESYGIAVDSSGNAVIAGHTYGDFTNFRARHSYGYDIFLLKLSSSGSEMWKYQAGAVNRGGPSDTAYAIAIDANDNIYTAGVTQGSLAGQAEYSYCYDYRSYTYCNTYPSLFMLKNVHTICPPGSYCTSAGVSVNSAASGLPCPEDSFCPAGSTSPFHCPYHEKSPQNSMTSLDCSVKNEVLKDDNLAWAIVVPVTFILFMLGIVGLRLLARRGEEDDNNSCCCGCCGCIKYSMSLLWLLIVLADWSTSLAYVLTEDFSSKVIIFACMTAMFFPVIAMMFVLPPRSKLWSWFTLGRPELTLRQVFAVGPGAFRRITDKVPFRHMQPTAYALMLQASAGGNAVVTDSQPRDNSYVDSGLSQDGKFDTAAPSRHVPLRTPVGEADDSDQKLSVISNTGQLEQIELEVVPSAVHAAAQQYEPYQPNQDPEHIFDHAAPAVNENAHDVEMPQPAPVRLGENHSQVELSSAIGDGTAAATFIPFPQHAHDSVPLLAFFNILYTILWWTFAMIVYPVLLIVNVAIGAVCLLVLYWLIGIACLLSNILHINVVYDRLAHFFYLYECFGIDNRHLKEGSDYDKDQPVTYKTYPSLTTASILLVTVFGSLPQMVLQVSNTIPVDASHRSVLSYISIVTCAITLCVGTLRLCFRNI
jgi:Beta-propeller repeat